MTLYWFLLDILLQKWCTKASDWRPLRSKDIVILKQKGPDDEQMSVFGSSEWPKADRGPTDGD